MREDRYSAERGRPGLPACGRAPLRLTFDGTAMRLIGSRPATYVAVSGRPGADGRFDYSAARQRVADQGPIPEGEYWIEPSQLQKNAWYRFRNPTFAWGDYWITIHPYPSTVT